MDAREFWKTLPHCLGYAGGCDGDLEGLEHDPPCPLYGKREITMFEFAEAYAASLRKQINTARLEVGQCHRDMDDMRKILVANGERITELEAHITEIDADRTRMIVHGCPGYCQHTKYIYQKRAETAEAENKTLRDALQAFVASLKPQDDLRVSNLSVCFDELKACVKEATALLAGKTASGPS